MVSAKPWLPSIEVQFNITRRALYLRLVHGARVSQRVRARQHPGRLTHAAGNGNHIGRGDCVLDGLWHELLRVFISVAFPAR